VIPTRGLEEAYDGVFFDGTRKWHTVGVDDVEQAMRDLRESPQDARRPLDFTWDAGAKRLAEYLEAL